MLLTISNLWVRFFIL